MLSLELIMWITLVDGMWAEVTHIISWWRYLSYVLVVLLWSVMLQLFPALSAWVLESEWLWSEPSHQSVQTAQMRSKLYYLQANKFWKMWPWKKIYPILTDVETGIMIGWDCKVFPLRILFVERRTNPIFVTTEVNCQGH